MMYLAAIFALISLAPLVLVLVRLDGATATIFSFVGYPALGLALLFYFVARWRAGGFRTDGPPGP